MKNDQALEILIKLVYSFLGWKSFWPHISQFEATKTFSILRVY